MSLAHCAVAEKSFLALKALFACQPQLINQVITEGDFENYAPINYFLAMLVSKIDFRLDQYLPPDHVIDHGIIEEYERCEIFGFFSPLVTSTREKNILVLLSLYVLREM